MRKSILLALLVFIPASASAEQPQVHPNLEKGFAADKMYQFNNVDNVNLFNGNLTFTIPLGGSIPASDRLATSMTLVYNSKLWDATQYRDGSMPAGQETRTWKTPTARSNAGLGWMVSFGRMFEGATSNTDLNDSDIVPNDSSIHYESPDGADHVIHNTGLHSDSIGGYYSRDGSYIRMTDGNPRLIETPDGTVREFSSYMDGTRRRWRITKLRDSFGNYIDFDYTTALQWKITDQYNRVTTVHFKDIHTPDTAVVNLTPAYLTAIDYIEVPSLVDGVAGTARFNFTYENRWVWTGYCGDNDVASKLRDTDEYRVPMLLKVELPDSSSWNFAYANGTNVSKSAVVDPGDCSGGALTSATLPTLGVMSWTYMMYEMPTAGCSDDPIGSSTGIKTRTLTDPTNSNVSGTWTYSQTLTPENDAQWPCAPNEFILFYAPAEESITTVTDPDLNRTSYHFSVWPVTFGPTATRSDGATYREYGLAFSHKFPAVGGKLLSTEAFQHAADVNHPETLKRTTYVKYERDPVGVISNLDSNRSLIQSRTVFNDDGANYLDVSYSDNDGVGHYRTTTTSGTFLGTGSARTVTTDYNKNSSLVGSNIFQTGTYDSTGVANTFSTPPTSSPWLVNLFSRVVTTEGSSTAIQETCFEPSTGFLKGTRTYAGGSRAPADLVAAFVNDAHGAVISEKYYGGDVSPLTADPQATLCALLGAPGTLGYDIHHSYDSGVRKSSEYFSGGATVGFKFLDLDIDGNNTALPTASRDTAGVATSYRYDSSRRLTRAQTSTDPPINYAYTSATGSTGASATISQSSGTSGTPQVAFQFDGFGRLVSHSSTLPSTTPGVPRWSRQKTVFDGMGRKSMVSESEESNTPSHFTFFSDFDAFGRPRTVTKPDGTVSSAQYSGSRKVESTAYIHTQSGQPDTATVTTELYDVHGRLYDVLEPGSNLHASYTYDIGNRLQSASITGDGVTQTRSFNYDNRGFLLSEAHPELGSGGTTYDHYDARGHAHHKLSGVANGVYDLQLAYDQSERLTTVSDQNGARELKRFLFINQNDTNANPQNYRNGKLAQAVRTNHLPTGDVVVTETYKYDAPTGRLSSRQTDVTSGTTTLQSYQQAFAYDDIGEITNPGYPACANTLPCGSTPLAGATFTYKDGSLVTVPGYASSISYLGNMLSQVVHQAGATDTYNQDPTNGLPRPSSIGFSNWSTTCPVPAAPVITAATSVPAGSTGNVATVPADGTLQYAWSLTGGTITASAANSITFTAGANGTVALSVTASFVSNSCGPGPAGTRNVAIQQQQLSPPINFSTTLNGNTSVTLAWSPGPSGPTSYRMERKDCFSCGWVPIGPTPTSATTYTDTVNSVSGNPPAAHLYHVIAVANGSSDSPPSLPDYAVTASTLFAESIGTGTPVRIRGSHVVELRKAIDALRSLANLPPYTAGWTDYNAPTGTVLAIHQTDMRTALDQAVFNLVGYHLSFTGTTPAHDVGIAESHLAQLRNAVK